ncbi:MAG: VWA domain-containing protein, partial [Chitinophagaceae bacterium]|nr:VWA domain-containing protein [Chitinophagaceae bacterium]
MFHFQHIEYLFVLAAIPIMLVLFFLLRRWKKKAVQKIGEPHLVKQLIRGFSHRLFTLKFFLIIIGFALCALAVAGLVKKEGSLKVNSTGIDVMIALDVSNSMLADDITPNRLERAKQVVSKIIDKLSDNRIGIVIFAGRAYVQMPMTTDHSAAKMYLSAVSPDDIPAQGTVISQALKTSYAAFTSKEKKYRSIILITDGEDHDEEAIKVTRQLAEDGIMINTIGIGSPQGAPIKDIKTNDYKKDENGAVIISRLNEEVLKSIAQNGNGLYQLFTTTNEVAGNIQNKLSGLGQTALTDTAFATYKNYFWYFLLAALIILTIEFFIPEKKNYTWQTTMKSSAVIVIMLLLSNVSFAQQTNKAIKNGNQAYKKNQFETAASSYQKALSKDPDNNIALYNLGNTLYKTDKPEDAAKLYDNAIKSSTEKDIKAKGYYNKGVAFQKQNKLPECIDAYKNALKLAPNDEEARQNLQRALMQLKQQKKPEEQKNKKEQKQENEEQKQQPKPQPSRISKRDAEEKLKSLSEHEKNL